MSKILKSDLFDKIPNVDAEKFHAALSDALKNFTRKIIVLDDDPTGVQTVNGISVYTDWTAESIAAGFAEENSMFFILTNSRALSADKTCAEHKKIAETICAAAVGAIRRCAGIIRLKLKLCARLWRRTVKKSTEKF